MNIGRKTKNRAGKLWWICERIIRREMKSTVSIAVDIIVKKLVDEIHMGEEHPPAAIPGEPNFVQHFP